MHTSDLSTAPLPRAASAIRWLVRALLLLLVLPQLASADLTTKPGEKKKKKGEADYVPEAKPVNARFITGIPVDIELNAATAKIGPVKFIIREQPQYGTLSVIRAHPAESYKAIVTYTPNPGSTSLVDRFTYACKLEDSSWSAPSVVTLVGTRAMPKVEIMQAPSFGRILPKAEGSSRLVLKNTGIAPFAADIQWQSPWKGPPRIELGIGEQKEYLIAVTPTAPGTLTWETELQPGEPKSRLRLYVECTQLFIVAPGMLKLQYDEKSGNRHGKVGVANSTNETMSFSIEPPDRIRSVKRVEVPSKQSVDVEISLAPDDVGIFRGELWVVNEPYRERVLIEAAPEPPQAVLVSPASGGIDLGTQQKGKTGQGKIVMKNVGGEPAVMAAQIAPPFRVVESDAAVSIAPGETRELTVEGSSDHAGNYTGSVLISGTGGKLSVATKLAVIDPNTPQSIRPGAAGLPKSTRAPIAKSKSDIAPMTSATADSGKTTSSGKGSLAAAPNATMAPGDRPPAEAGKPVKLTNAESAVLAYISTFGMPFPKEMVSSHLQKVERVELVKQGKDSLVFAWKDQDPKPASYRVEQACRIRNEPTGRWLKAWAEMPNVEFIKGEEGKRTVRVTKLAPGSRYEVRVLGVDEESKVSEPSDIYGFATAAPWRMPSWAWQVLVAIALVIFIFIYIRLKRGSWAL